MPLKEVIEVKIIIHCIPQSVGDARFMVYLSMRVTDRERNQPKKQSMLQSVQQECSL